MNEETLIDAVREYPILWDHKHFNYNNRNLRIKAFNEIANLLGDSISGEDVKTKWHSLRTSFVRNYKQTTRHKSGDNGESQVMPKWKHFQRMLFLRDSIRADHRAGNVNDMEQSMSGDSQSRSVGDSDDNEIVYQNSDSLLNEFTIETPTQPKKRLKKNESNERTDVLDSVLSRLLTQSEDVDILWAKSLALKLKRFPVHQRELIKYDIDGVVLRASGAQMSDIT